MDSEGDGVESTRLTVQDTLVRLAADARLRRAAENRTMSHEIVRRYVAGESISSAMDVASWLMARGRAVSLTHLVSEPQDLPRTEKRAKRLCKLMRRLADAGLTGDGRADISVRTSALGAGLGGQGRTAARDHLAALAAEGQERGITLTLELESGVPSDVTLDLFRDLHAAHPETGISLQAARRRCEDDCRALAATGARVRLTKGVPGRGSDAYARRSDIDRAYVRCLQALMEGPGVVAVATHDERLLELADRLARRLERDRASVEYQLRYGVRPEKQADLADRGDRLRVYVPFGEDWYPYLAQRVADSPRDIFALFKATAR